MIARDVGICLLALSLASPAGAQEITAKANAPKTLKFKPDSVVLLKELGVLVGHEQGVLKVLLAPPSGGKVKGVQTVDLATGDEVGMAAGKRIRLAGELRELYEGADTGSEFKLGVRREGKPIVVTFTKKDPEELAAGGMMIIRPDDPEEEGSRLFPALGFRLAEEGGGLIVTEVLPGGPFELKTGDRIHSLNGEPAPTLQAFESVLASIEVGDEATLLVRRKDTELTFSAHRPEPRGMILKVK